MVPGHDVVHLQGSLVRGLPSNSLSQTDFDRAADRGAVAAPVPEAACMRLALKSRRRSLVGEGVGGMGGILAGIPCAGRLAGAGCDGGLALAR
jgi:hypothetical protein